MMTDGSPSDIVDDSDGLEISDSHTLTLATALLVGMAVVCAIVHAGTAIARAIAGRSTAEVRKGP